MLIRVMIVVLLLVCPPGVTGEALFQQDPSSRIQALFDACDRPDSPGGFAAAEFYPESDTKFFRKDFDAQFAFLRDARGAIDRLVYYFRGSPTPPFRKLNWRASEQPDVADILGEYYSPELRTRYRLMVSNDRLVMWHLHNEEAALLRLNRDRYLGDRWWCEEIEIVRDEND